MSETVLEKVTINGVTYVKEGSEQAKPAPGKRAVVVVDRGWIFAGDLEEQDDKLVLSRAVQVLNWQRNGFAGMVANPTDAGAKLLKLTAQVVVPKDSEIFRCPVGDTWGL